MASPRSGTSPSTGFSRSGRANSPAALAPAVFIVWMRFPFAFRMRARFPPQPVPDPGCRNRPLVVAPAPACPAAGPTLREGPRRRSTSAASVRSRPWSSSRRCRTCVLPKRGAGIGQVHSTVARLHGVSVHRGGQGNERSCRHFRRLGVDSSRNECLPEQDQIALPVPEPIPLRHVFGSEQYAETRGLRPLRGKRDLQWVGRCHQSSCFIPSRP